MDYGMNKSETARLKSEITKVYEAIIARTKDCEDSERNSALYSLQDFLGGINCPTDDNKIEF